MSALLVGDIPLLQGTGVLFLDYSVVGEEYVESFYFKKRIRKRIL